MLNFKLIWQFKASSDLLKVISKVDKRNKFLNVDSKKLSNSKLDLYPEVDQAAVPD